MFQKPNKENNMAQLSRIIVDNGSGDCSSEDTRDCSSKGEYQPQENKPHAEVQQDTEQNNTDAQEEGCQSQAQQSEIHKNRVQKLFSFIANTIALYLVPENIHGSVNVSCNKIIGLILATLLIGSFIGLYYWHSKCYSYSRLTLDTAAEDMNSCKIDPIMSPTLFTTVRLDTNSKWEGDYFFSQETAFWQVKFVNFASTNASNFQDVLNELRGKVNGFLERAVNFQTFDLLQYFLHTRFDHQAQWFQGFAQLMPSFSLTSFVQTFQISKLQFFRAQQLQNCSKNDFQNCEFSANFETIKTCGVGILGPFLKYDINRLGVSNDYYKISIQDTEFQVELNLLKEMQNDGIAQFFDSDTCEESLDIIKNTTLYSQLDYSITVREIPYFECETCKDLDISFDFALVNALDFCNKNIEVCSEFYTFKNNVAELPSPEVFMKIKQISQSRYQTSSASFYNEKIGKFAYTKYELGNEYSIVPEIIPSCNLCTSNQTNLSDQRDCYKEFDIVLHHYLKRSLTDSLNSLHHRSLLQKQVTIPNMDVSEMLNQQVLNHLGFIGSKSYYFSLEKLSWTESFQRCKSLGGNLLQLDSNITEFTVNVLLQTSPFYKFTKNFDDNTNFWIGLQTGDGYRQQWTTGLNSGYSNYCQQNQSSKIMQKEQMSCVSTFLKFKKEIPSSCWQAYSCSSKNAFVCEFFVDIKQQIGSIPQPPPPPPRKLSSGIPSPPRPLTEEVQMEPYFEDLQPIPQNSELITESGYQFQTDNNQNFNQQYQFSVLVSLKSSDPQLAYNQHLTFMPLPCNGSSMKFMNSRQQIVFPQNMGQIFYTCVFQSCPSMLEKLALAHSSVEFLYLIIASLMLLIFLVFFSKKESYAEDKNSLAETLDAVAEKVEGE